MNHIFAPKYATACMAHIYVVNLSPFCHDMIETALSIKPLAMECNAKNKKHEFVYRLRKSGH